MTSKAAVPPPATTISDMLVANAISDYSAAVGTVPSVCIVVWVSLSIAVVAGRNSIAVGDEGVRLLRCCWYCGLGFPVDCGYRGA